MKEKRKNYKGEIVEIDVASEEEARLLLEQYHPISKITLQDALAKGHVLLEDFDKQIQIHNRRSNNIPMRPLRWLSPLEFTVQHV